MRIGLVVNPRKPLARKFVPALASWLQKQGHESLAAADLNLSLPARRLPVRQLVRHSDLVLALGGDGTLLRAAHLVGPLNRPIMGINLGELGFLTEFSTKEARAGIRAFVSGRHAEEQRMLLVCRLGSRRGFALNDCALNMGTSGRVIDVIARAGNVFVNRFVGDGVVVATPTGSTAYSLAAGGPVVHPTMQAILLTPLAPHALAARPLLLPADTQLELTLAFASESAILNLDGQRRWRLQAGQTVTITRADFFVRLVVPRHRSYYSILRNKLKWAGSQV